MSEPSSSPHLLKSAGAVLAGLVTVVVLSIAVDAIMHATGALPPMGSRMGHGHAALALGYRLVIGVLGGWVTAWLAPQRPIKHALILGLFGLALSTLGAAATWNVGPAFGPKWYPLALVATALPCSWLGGKIYTLRALRSVSHGG